MSAKAPLPGAAPALALYVVTGVILWEEVDCQQWI